MIDIAQYSSDDVIKLVCEIKGQKENPQAENIFKLLFMMRKEAKLPKLKKDQHEHFVRIGFVPTDMEMSLPESEKEESLPASGTK
jgi:hypothetical protein